jgi:hypothetical protein
MSDGAGHEKEHAARRVDLLRLRSIRATKDQAVSLPDAACVRLAGGLGFERDDKVGML